MGRPETITMPELNGSLTAPPAVSSSVTAYRRIAQPVQYGRSLVVPGKDYYRSKSGLPEGMRFSTADEELALQLAEERAGRDPRTAIVFNDLFARNETETYVWQHTETGLRLPPGTQHDYFVTDPEGNKYWPRIVLIGAEEAMEVLVPEGNGRVVTKWDEVFGLPKRTEDLKWPHTPHTTHLWFNPNPEKDKNSGHYDVAVERRSYWHRGEDERCLEVDANYGRWDAGSGDGFRPVRGSLPEIERRQIMLEPDAVEKALDALKVERQ